MRGGGAKGSCGARRIRAGARGTQDEGRREPSGVARPEDDSGGRASAGTERRPVGALAVIGPASRRVARVRGPAEIHGNFSL